MRLIDADALLENLRLDLRIKGEINFDDIKEAITNAPTIQREGWVSVQDGVPENDTTVICVDIPSKYIKTFEEGKYIPATDEIFGACFVKGEWTYEPYSDYESSTRVTHWQPLPVAPIETE